MFKSFITILLLGYTGITVGAVCDGPDVITDPPAFQWTLHPASGGTEEYYSGTLEMGEATFTIAGETLTTRAYRQQGSAYSIPGPSLHMTPGNKYVVQFKNTLPFEALSTDHNTFKDPNVTNLHTHGVHISGETPSDDVTRFFEGGFGGDFVYDIPADHMGGSFWYHAHHHGSTFLQVSSGAFGNIIIDDSLDGMPANVANMAEKQLILGFLDPAVAGTGGDTLISGTLGATWTVNGMKAGTGRVCIPPNTWQHWRVLLADRDSRMKTIAIGDQGQCEVALMARDGVWRTEAPLNLSPGNAVTITGASRADLAVRCSADADIRVDNELMAGITVDGITDTTVHPYNTDGVSPWSAIRPSYLRDLRAETPGNFETVSMGARTINGSKFDALEPTFILPATDIQEWTVKGARQHPFHLHVYHMQMTEDCNEFEGGEYYDTIATNCDVRFDLNAATADVFSGRTIMHCHILSHEDQGAMGWADIVGGLAPPTFPVGTAYQAYYPLGGGGTPPLAPSSLAASAVSSSQVDLSWVDNASNEGGFDVERSTDGVNFALEAALAANATSYSDNNGLAASTLYYYRVRATSTNGNSDYSNIASATTLPDVAGTTMAVSSVMVSTMSQGKGQKSGHAVVVITDDQGAFVEGAVIAGSFSGGINEVISASAPTNAMGSTTINTSGTAKGGIALTFCVDAITPPAGSTLQPYTGPQVCGSL